MAEPDTPFLTCDRGNFWKSPTHLDKAHTLGASSAEERLAARRSRRARVRGDAVLAEPDGHLAARVRGAMGVVGPTVGQIHRFQTPPHARPNPS